MEAICSPETSVDFQRTTMRYIPEDGTHTHNVALKIIMPELKIHKSKIFINLKIKQL
jgi:hypothetical protein